ncbi:hypothetical protein MC885_009828, partial [Smutsia gigantea]
EYIDEHGRCQICEASCAKCRGPTQEDCTGCPVTRIFDDGRCVLNCPSGKFEFKNQCHPCHYTCQECQDNEPSNCISCGVGHEFTLLTPALVEMRKKLKDVFPEEKERACRQDVKHKIDSKDKYGWERFLYQGECRKSCPAGHYPADGYICLPCPDNCEICHSAHICIQCMGGYFVLPTNHTCQKLVCGQDLKRCMSVCDLVQYQ